MWFNAFRRQLFGRDNRRRSHPVRRARLEVEALEHRAVPSVSSAAWMSQVPNATTLGQMSLPGTHDTMTWAFLSVHSASPFAQTQDLSLRQQLDAGIRFLDIRLGTKGSFSIVHGWTESSNDLEAYHGSLDTGTAFVRDVLGVVKSFLAAHPSETIVMSVKNDYTTRGLGAPVLTTDQFDATFHTIWQNSNADWIKAHGKPLWYVGDSIPSLGQVRGQIVLLRRFDAGSKDQGPPGIDATHWPDNSATAFTTGNLMIEDHYDPADPATKEKDISGLVHLANRTDPAQDSKWYIAFTSAVTDIRRTPRQWATGAYGFSGIDSWLPRDLPAQGRLGTLVMDFPSRALIRQVFSTNFPPSFRGNTLTVDRGATVTLTNRTLGATDQNGVPLVYTLTTPPQHGTLYVHGLELGAGGMFTQMDVNNGAVVYRNDGNTNAHDGFAFHLSNGSPTGSIDSSASIAILGVPTLSVNSGLRLNQGATAAITRSMLLTTGNDPHQGPENIIYQVTKLPQVGLLIVRGQPLHTGGTFTQELVNHGEVVYRHFGSNHLSDGFLFTVSDSTATDAISGTFTIAINRLATLKTNADLQVNQGATAVITGRVLQADDGNGPASATLVFTITRAPQFGTLMTGSRTLAVGDTFTQADIAQGGLAYHQDGSSHPSDAFAFSLRTGDSLGTVDGTVQVTITATGS
jgi:hypothetical protein